MQAIRFAESRKYDAINNNCIQNTDFFCRILTSGKVRNAPMIYDLLAGKIPEQDHPMLLMFFLMTRLSWWALPLSFGHVNELTEDRSWSCEDSMHSGRSHRH